VDVALIVGIEPISQLLPKWQEWSFLACLVQMELVAIGERTTMLENHHT
jgi:hypothetical protein